MSPGSESKASSGSRDLQDVKKHLTVAAALLQTFGKPIIEGLTVALPIIIQAVNKAYAWFQKLPQNVINFSIGFVFCFFGGLYPVLFAAIEAAEFGGRKTVMDALRDLSQEALIIIEESKKDDDVDKDKDGKADVTEISKKEFIARKAKLVLTKMNPQKVDKAIKNLYRVWLSVAAVLSIEFARTISMALAISDFMKQPIDRFVAPTLQLAIPDEYDRWVPVVLGWLTKSISMSIAWYIQAIRSAFASALTGGLMMARSALQALQYRDITLGGWVAKDQKDTSLDEILSYVFAAIGFYFQFKLGFDMPFPFNLLLWPFEVAEYYLRWSITTAPQ